MGWWLSVFIFVNGAWTPGAEVDVDGWSPREYESRRVCETRRDFTIESLERATRAGNNISPTYWVCNEGEPLTTVPAELEPPKDE